MADGLNRKKANSLLQMSGITHAPVNITKIAEDLGFDIIEHNLTPQRKGAMLIEGKVRGIVVNNTYSDGANRFTVAHEIGHFVSGHQQCQKNFVNDDSRFFNKDFHQEREADIFAAELLIPKTFLEQDVQKLGLDIEKLAEHYQVSRDAIQTRLKTLHFFDKYSYKK